MPSCFMGATSNDTLEMDCGYVVLCGLGHFDQLAARAMSEAIFALCLLLNKQ